ncbi:MAG TPA: hypothetical protein VK009_06780 [Chloroflexota bacterium]|nr:hypothetical protein [Chloroflexota bacterium]
MNDPRAQTCFACGEVNSADSRFCKFCGRPLVRPEQRPTVAQDPRNRILLWLVLILIVVLAVFFVIGLLTSKVFR